jgi:hypothetical protein
MEIRAAAAIKGVASATELVIPAARVAHAAKHLVAKNVEPQADAAYIINGNASFAYFNKICGIPGKPTIR